ncbi:hypothetical protein NLG97_g10888 [Lecanicillium saksenae]|uniref:Uncharacterized protein n=1 Tax=Lecanicillium saksenae TaxID=468837 RepID=A0ACC1QC33_9HYPO|nr:hypothetical protein NLG97_g10888 [Lecanicillium saksenae]
MAAAQETQQPVAAPAGDAAGDAVATPTGPKLHGRAFYESIGSPKFIVAPMVNQSEFVSTPRERRKRSCAATASAK